MYRHPPRLTRTDTPFPYPTRFRPCVCRFVGEVQGVAREQPTRGMTAELAELKRAAAAEIGRDVEPAGEKDVTAHAAARHTTEGECLSGIDVDRLTARRSEEHTSELQSLMRISYADFCLKNKN